MDDFKDIKDNIKKLETNIRRIEMHITMLKILVILSITMLMDYIIDILTI